MVCRLGVGVATRFERARAAADPQTFSRHRHAHRHREKNDSMNVELTEEECSSSSAAPAGEAAVSADAAAKPQGRHWVRGVGYRPGPAPEAAAIPAAAARASSRVRRESGRYASSDEEESRPKKKKKKKKKAEPAKRQAKKKLEERVCHMTVSAEGAGAAVTISKKDASMTSQRRLRTALAEPAYDLELVPSAARDLAGSALVRVEGTASWERLIGEMLLLCNEASWRYVQAERARPGPRRLELAPTEPKPLMLEYISDRVDTDEPLWGYVARTSAEGWMQGFVCVTQFTTWQPYFRWTSGAPSAGVTADDVASHAVDGRAPTLDAAASVGTGAVSLTRELQCARRGGDPEGEGVVWPRVAEVSLLGGLGCGRTLLQLVLDELHASKDVDFVVLQATDQAVPFYEKMGFSRVGAVASFELKADSFPLEAVALQSLRSLGERLYWARRMSRALLKALCALDGDQIFACPVDCDARGGNKRAIQRRFNVVFFFEATPERHAATLRGRPER